MLNAMTREKEIRYSSRTRTGTDQFKRIQKLRRAAAGLLEQLPEHLKNSPEAKLLGTVADRKVFNIIHLIYRARNYEGHSKDYEFSRASMEEHWRAGYRVALTDGVRTGRFLRRATPLPSREQMVVFLRGALVKKRCDDHKSKRWIKTREIKQGKFARNKV